MGYVIFCLPSSNTRQYVLQKLKLLQYMLHSIKLWISWADPQAATEVWIRYIIINYVTSPNWIYVMLLSELISDSDSSWWYKLGNHLPSPLVFWNKLLIFICISTNLHDIECTYFSVYQTTFQYLSLQYISWNSAHSTTYSIFQFYC